MRPFRRFSLCSPPTSFGCDIWRLSGCIAGPLSASNVCSVRMTSFLSSSPRFSSSCADGNSVDCPLHAGATSNITASSSPSSLLSSAVWSRNVYSEDVGAVELSEAPRKAEHVEDMFRSSVLARTVGNLHLRRYVQQLEPKEHALALAAVRGARAGGLRVDAKTNELLLSKLVEGGQLRESMDVYQSMIQNRMTPTANTYATLMHICLERELSEACQKLFLEMVKRGQSPTTRNYELYITSLAMEARPKWEEAVKVFDHISRERRGRHLTATTYNALMRVYLNMVPFDWRVVYNCYHELRHRDPPIQLQWTSYQLVAEALRRGRAGYIRRFLTYLDAWFAVTHFRSWEFLVGVSIYIGLMLVLKSLLSWVVVYYYNKSIAAKKGAAESILP